MTLRALSIDDEKHNLLLIEAMAGELGLGVVSHIRPREALAAFAGGDFDLVFVDYMMPGMNGIEVVKTIREARSDIPVIMITSVTDDNDLKLHALEAGATEFLNKPLNIAEFKARTTNLMELRKSQILLRDRAKLLESEVMKATEQIRAREHETLEVLGRAAEYKDQETGAHITRVAFYSRMLARCAGESAESQDIIFNAAPLHDIGKIGISDIILTKPLSLDSIEETSMRKHPEIGHDMLKDAESPYLKAGAVISLNHHEKYDGSGYPRGLKGDGIHLYGRIVAIADVFDALCSKRPYKDPWPMDRILPYLRDQRGRHFDPELLDHFFAHMDEVNNIYTSIRDDE